MQRVQPHTYRTDRLAKGQVKPGLDRRLRLRMFDRVLIANRGAIAVRIARTLDAMGIDSVAVYADADKDSLHTQVTSEAFPLGASNVTETYLDIEKICDIAVRSGANAVHPGYGFLSENAEFCRALEERNIVFIGPRSEHLTRFGLKHEARRLAAEAYVNLLPGSGVLNTLDDALASAEQIGYPVMLKSSAGGGGIGMLRCADEGELKSQYATVQRLAGNAFSDNRLFVETWVDSPRHVEVQAFGNGHGEVLILGDRDCSLQRRHQKVVEECPAPNLPDSVRERMHRDAEALLASVAYRSAGTVEFLYDPRRETASFLEVNTRLQVEHGVTEMVYGVDIVRWMLELAADELPPLEELKSELTPSGSAIQARLCAEDPNHDFRPTPGLLSVVDFPSESYLRNDTWLQSGTAVSSYYDSLLAKVIAHGATREQARERLVGALQETVVHGIETNRTYLIQAIECEAFQTSRHDTGTLAKLDYMPRSVDVLAPGAQTTVQAYPGRMGYWNVGIPPSGPMDNLSFRVGNRLLGNAEGAPGLELTVTGPTLRFNAEVTVLVTGNVQVAVKKDDGTERTPSTWIPFEVKRNEELVVGEVTHGMRAYILFQGGLDIPDVMGSAATFTLGEIGGLNGRTLAHGDVLHIREASKENTTNLLLLNQKFGVPDQDAPFVIRITMGPHCTEDFMTADDLDEFLSARWTVHYHSSRTGIRLIGPRPKWARQDGGDAGLHPSNIHDSAYSFGAIDFTGDMPVILGPDGPSLGGFVCPAAVIEADRWKLGQLKAGDQIRFVPTSESEAVEISRRQQKELERLTSEVFKKPRPSKGVRENPIVFEIDDICVRRAAQDTLLVEFGPNLLDLELRLRVHALQTTIEADEGLDVAELTPGIRSLLIRMDSSHRSREPLKSLEPHLRKARMASPRVSSRTIHLPLSWDDPACREAIERYTQSVRSDAPWCPDNIEFIRRINGLERREDVKEIVFDAEYFVMGLGDVYLGAPVATPVDPRQCLVTTKYNPARTWTAANSVGIGGAYMCIYGMEGPGGYQFLGRTLQVWDQYQKGKAFTEHWLLRNFDRIRFYEVDANDLLEMREALARGSLDVQIEQGTFDYGKYSKFLNLHDTEIATWQQHRRAAFAQELDDWRARGLMTLETTDDGFAVNSATVNSEELPFVSSPLAGSVWSVQVQSGQSVEAGDVLFVVESMKTEFEVSAPSAGTVKEVLVCKGQTVQAGQALAVAMV